MLRCLAILALLCVIPAIAAASPVIGSYARHVHEGCYLQLVAQVVCDMTVSGTVLTDRARCRFVPAGCDVDITNSAVVLTSEAAGATLPTSATGLVTLETSVCCDSLQLPFNPRLTPPWSPYAQTGNVPVGALNVCRDAGMNIASCDGAVTMTVGFGAWSGEYGGCTPFEITTTETFDGVAVDEAYNQVPVGAASDIVKQEWDICLSPQGDVTLFPTGPT